MRREPERLQSRLEPGERALSHGSPYPRSFSWPGVVGTLGSTTLLVSLIAGAPLAGLVLCADVGALLDQVRIWSALALVTGLAGLWSLAVLRRMRPYPQLHRQRRPTAWLPVAWTQVWFYAMPGSCRRGSTGRGSPCTT